MKTSLAFLLLSVTLSASGSSGVASIAATPLPATAAIKLEGAFSDAIWEHVPAVSDFRQRDPKDGAAPTFATDVKVAYDASNLYVAVRAHDPEPNRIVAMRTRRDTDSPSDWLKVIVDSYHDRRTAFEFGVNPAGVKEDRAWSNDGNDDSGWDAVWDVAVSRDQEGWRAEFRIPFSQLRFNPSDNATFGFAVIRQIGRLNETDTWPLISKSANGFVSNFGDLTNLKLSRTPKRLELIPYLVGQLNTQPVEAGNPLVSSRSQKGTIGADLKYALRPGVTLTATVNPDFGQVEADPAVVNLTGFETFFSERRPFFVEGAGTFAFDLDCNDGSCSGLFYPRRIGRAPRGAPDLGAGMYASVPQQTKIWGAAKLTGRLGGFSFGALNALTADEQATIAIGTERLHQSVEPMSNYSVVRARREFANQSSVGFMLTGTTRRLNPFTSFLPRQAVTGGADWDVRFQKSYSLRGHWVGSTIHGTADAIDRLQRSTVHSFQRPDADYLQERPLATSLNGDGGSIGLSKIAGSKVRFNTNVGFKSPGLDINDVGFMRRADIRSMGNWIQFRNETPSKHLRSWRFNLNQWGSWNFGGDRLDLGGNVNAHWRFAKNWGTGMGFTSNARRFDDRATRGGGPGAYRNPNSTYWAYVEADDRKPVTPMTFFNVGTDRHGSRWFGISPSVTVRPTSFLSVNGGIDWNREIADAQWIQNTAGGQYVFGRLDQSTLSLTARVNYTITPRLTVQVYAAPFVSAGGYTSFKELVNGRAPRYENRYAPFAYDGSPDFNYRSFRTTNVLRWEYRPGSALFVVWQQGREDVASDGRFQFGRDFGGVFGAPSRNAFLVKWSYWINQ